MTCLAFYYVLDTVFSGAGMRTGMCCCSVKAQGEKKLPHHRVWEKEERCRKMGSGWGWIDIFKCFGAKHLQTITWGGGLSPVWVDGSLWRADPLPVSGFYYCCYDAAVMSSGQNNTCITALSSLAWFFQLYCSHFSVFSVLLFILPMKSVQLLSNQ